MRERVLACEIVVMATPTWLGQPSSVIKRALERMVALLSETDDDGVPVANNRAGVVVTGHEDGAHHVISEVAGALIDVGYTVPGQARTSWNKGPGPGEDEDGNTDERAWSDETGRAMVHNLLHAAQALQALPIPKSPSA